MNEYVDRARSAIAAFQAALLEMEDRRARLAPSSAVVNKRIEALTDISRRLQLAAKRLEHSLSQIAGDTALDVVDLQVRMEGEGAALASALRALDEALEKTPEIGTLLERELQTLKESAERMAAALFPNAIDGVREINRTLWDFRPIWSEYVRVMGREVSRTSDKRLTADQIAKVEQTAERVRAGFEEVNQLLNKLVISSSFRGAPDVASLIQQARRALSAAIRDARSKAADTYRLFHGVLNRAERLAQKIDKQFAELRVPVFPDAQQLEDLAAAIDAASYAAFAGVERFALLNIGARLRSIPLADGSGHLLSPRFNLRVFDAFPDRIYMTADASFIGAVEALAKKNVFESADSTLHKFNDGSFKQRQRTKGNLQLSYAFGTPEQRSDRSKVSVDADIDLFRSPVKHLFGEVLINHLTGGKTDQFRVWDLMTALEVAPIGGFTVVTPTA